MFSRVIAPFQAGRLANAIGPAIWDNRCAYHAPTPDYRGSRGGWRVLGVGEVPYMDPNSVSRAEGLAMLGKYEIAKGKVGEHTSLT